MVRKRRTFDIDMPAADDTPETFPAGEDAPTRRGPMASAIVETAGAARERQETERAIREENDALAHEFVRLKALGLVVALVPLDEIRTHKLVRDRTIGADKELDELVESIRSLGLSNPIRVEQADGNTYELIQGYRRLAAYKRLLEETGDVEAYGSIPAAVWREGLDLAGLYRQMVDENLVRKNISFAEMAQLAIDYAADPGTPETDPDKAVAELFASSGYQKRSYIRAFIRVLEPLGVHLEHKEEMPRALGVALAARIGKDRGLVQDIVGALGPRDGRDKAMEFEVLRRFAGTDETAQEGREDAPPAALKRRRSAAKTSFQLERDGHSAKCTASAGRLEVRMDRDFSAIERQRLEAAIRKLLDELS